MGTEDARSQVSPGFPPLGWRSLISPAWRFWVADAGTGAAEYLISVTADSECFARVEGIVAAVISGRPDASPTVVRLARDETVLRRLNQIPAWAGRAVTLYMKNDGHFMQMARDLDAALAGQGLAGPPSLRGRPYGGPSGMLFLGGLPGGKPVQSPGPADRLTALLGGARA